MNTIFIIIGTVVLICTVLIAAIVMNINSKEDETGQNAGKQQARKNDHKDKDDIGKDSDKTGSKDQDIIQGIDSQYYYAATNKDSTKDDQMTLNVLKITVRP